MQNTKQTSADYQTIDILMRLPWIIRRLFWLLKKYFGCSKNMRKFTPYTNLLKMGVVKLNRIKAVLADSGRQWKWLAQQLGKDPTAVSKWCTNTIQPDLKTLAEIAELLNLNIRELLVNTNKTMTSQSAKRLKRLPDPHL